MVIKTKIIEESDEKIAILLSDTDRAFVNAIRRTLISDTPKMAIDTVRFEMGTIEQDGEIWETNGPLPDEVVAQRLAMIPIPTKHDEFHFQGSCPTCAELVVNDRGCPQCTMIYTCKAFGTEDGRILRLKGQGMAGFGGGADGNAYVEVLVDPDPVFRRQKNDIHVDVPVTLSEAVLGGRIEAPTIDGMVNLTVPKGSNTGTQLRLKGKGLKSGDKGTGPRGDQFVHLRVVLPNKPDKDLIRFLEEWSPDRGTKARPRTAVKKSDGK